MGHLYIAYNGTEAVGTFTSYSNSQHLLPAPVAINSNTPKTMLQIATPSTREIIVVEYGFSFDGNSAVTPMRCALEEHAVAATVTTSFTPQPYSNPGAPASLCPGGTSATGYTGTAEGTTTSTHRIFDLQQVSNLNQYVKQWPLGREPRIAVSKFLRLRMQQVSALSTPAVYCYIIWEE